MGHKIQPINYRLGVLTSWRSKWFAKRPQFKHWLKEDVSLRSYLEKKLAEARVEKIEIERSGGGKEVIINIHTAKPGLVIGRGGGGVEDLRREIEKKILGLGASVKINIHDIKQSSLSAAVVAQNVAADLLKRIPFRRAVKMAIDQVLKAGAKGVKIQVAGRLNGAEIARTETLGSGNMPLHTLRANIDYANVPAFTTYGAIGVSVWIYKGQVFEKEPEPKGEDVFKEIKDLTAKAKIS